MEKQKFIRMNVELPEFPQGQQWLYHEAPMPVKFWLENRSILFETLICSVVEHDLTNNVEQEVIYDKSTITIEHENAILFRKFNIIETKTVEESGVKKEVAKRSRKPKKKKEATLRKPYNSKAPKCKGVKSDGYPCRTTKLSSNGYCHHHQNQADIQNNN